VTSMPTVRTLKDLIFVPVNQDLPETGKLVKISTSVVLLPPYAT